ncbi:MAG TPA: pyrroline-5-carboxylate reductase [bacterium]|nr:pyrroline-5-carboxylate reductase [bacterium]
MSLKHQTVLLGFGSMGGALAKGWIQNKVLKPSQITAVSLDPAKRQETARQLKVKLVTDPSPYLPKADLILLAVKPQQLKALLGKVGGLFPRRALVLSVAAGVTTQQIESRLPQGCPVVRVMPNTPSTLGAGMSAVAAGSRATASDLKLAQALLSAVGRSVEVKESLMDLVTALSGSGPAYFFKMIEALVAAGEKGGLDGPTATLLAAQTAYGAARMVLETGKSPEALRVQVTSPGGTTEAGLTVLDQRGFGGALEAAVQAATQRGAELRRMNE